MAFITIALHNPASLPNSNEALLYLDPLPSDYTNTLDIVFTEASNHNQSFEANDYIKLKIPNTLISGLAADNFKDTTGWDLVVSAPAPDSIYYEAQLTAQGNVPFPVTISLINLDAAGTATSDSVYALLMVGGRLAPGCQSTLKTLSYPSSTGRDLTKKIDFTVDVNNDEEYGIASGKVYISPSDGNGKVVVPVANRIHVGLSYNQKGTLLENAWNENNAHPPKIMFFFEYGNDGSSLTDDLDTGDPGYDALTTGRKIVPSLGPNQESFWSMSVRNDAGKSPLLTVVPTKNNLYMFDRSPDIQQHLDIYFDHVITILGEGTTSLFVQWSKVPGFNDGYASLEITKQKTEPILLDFSGPDDTPNYGDSVKLTWAAFGVATLNLQWDAGHRNIGAIPLNTGTPALYYEGSTDDFTDDQKKSFVLDSPTTLFELSVVSPAPDPNDPYPLNKQLTVDLDQFPSPCIECLDGVLEVDGDGNITGYSFTWLVNNLGYRGSIYIDGAQVEGYYNNVPRTDPYSINADGNTHFNLDWDEDFFKAVQSPGSGSRGKSGILTLPTGLRPRITDLQGTISRDNNGKATGINITWHVQNSVYSNSQSNLNTYCKINGTVCDIDSNGNCSADFQLGDENPIQPYYKVEVVQPGFNNLDVQVLYPNFVKKRTLSTNIAPVALTLTSDKSYGVVAMLYGSDLYLGVFDVTGAIPEYIPASDIGLTISSVQSLMVSPSTDDPAIQQIFVMSGSDIYSFLFESVKNFYGLGFNMLPINSYYPLTTIINAVANSSDFSVWGVTVVNNDSTGTGTAYFSFSRQFPYLYPSHSTPYFNITTYENGGDTDLPAGIAARPDGGRIFISDWWVGALWHFDPAQPPAQLNQATAIYDVPGINNMAVADNNLLYWAGGEALGGNTVFGVQDAKNLTFYPYHGHTHLYNDKYVRMKVAAGVSVTFAINPGNEFFLIPASTQETYTSNEPPPVTQIAQVAGIFDIIILKDNTRILIGTEYGIELWEAEMVVVQGSLVS